MQASFFWTLIVTLGAMTVALAAFMNAPRLGAMTAEEWGFAGLLILAGATAQRLAVAMPNPRRSLGAYLLETTPAARERADCSRGATSGEDAVAAASAVHVFVLLALPTAPAVLLMTVAHALGTRWSGGTRQWLFGLASNALALGAGGVLAQSTLAWSAAAEVPAMAWIAPTTAYYAVKTSVVVALAALEAGLPPSYVWLQRRPAFLSELLLLLSGALLWGLWRADLLVPGALAVGVAAFAVYRSLRQSVHVQHQTVEALCALADLVDQRDAYTYQHSLRVGQYAERLALLLGCSREDARLIFLCGRLHDIGKCAVSNDVLLKPGPLSPSERAEMIRHAEIGARMLAHFQQFKVGAALVRAHHEWYDGRGYPDGLARSEIPLGARIIAVVDAYDAMTTDRPYRKALPHAEAVRRLQAGAGSQWDPRVVQKFLELLGEPPPALWLRASLRLRGKAPRAASTSGV